jgi:hypothetical protein
MVRSYYARAGRTDKSSTSEGSEKGFGTKLTLRYGCNSAARTDEFAAKKGRESGFGANRARYN